MPGHKTTVLTTLCAAANARTARRRTQENFTWTWPRRLPQVLAWLHFNARSLHGMTAYTTLKLRCATYLPSQMLFACSKDCTSLIPYSYGGAHMLWGYQRRLKWTTTTTNYRTAARKWGQIRKQRIRPTLRNWATKSSLQKERAPFRRQKKLLKKRSKG